MRAWWYARGEEAGPSGPLFSWSIPEDAERLDLAATRGGQVLSYDTGAHVILKGARRGPTLSVIYLEYETGNDRMLLDLFLHSPDICLPASGAKLEKEFPVHPFQLGEAGAEQDLIARHWLFSDPVNGQPLHVFKLVWVNDPEFLKRTLYSRDFKKIRLEAARQGREFGEARMLLVMVAGAKDEEKAWEAFQTQVLARATVASP